jgi:hypothetical protein
MKHQPNTDNLQDQPTMMNVSKKQRTTPIEVLAKATLENAPPFDVAMTKAFVNEYTHYEKSCKGRIRSFKSVVQFAAGSLLTPAQYELVLTKELRIGPDEGTNKPSQVRLL